MSNGEKHLDITRRLLGSSAIVHQEPAASDISVSLDIEGLVRRLLLFDTYLLYSVRLKEVPELVRHFGYDGTLNLLSSGALEIRCECAQFVEGQLESPPCPPLTFQFHVIDAHIWDQYLIDSLSEVNRTAGLTSRQMMELRSAVVRAVRRRDNRQMFSDIAPAFEADVLHNKSLLAAAIRYVLATKKGIASIDDFALKFHKVGEDRYEAETDLPQRLTLSVEEIHGVIKFALLGISGVNQRIGEMKADTALSGFTDGDLPLFSEKLGALADAYGSRRRENQFERVMAVSLPDFAPDGKVRVDMDKLLEIRNAPEALEFRSWIADSDKLSDSEIKQRIAGLTAKLGVAVQTTTGKLIRFLVTSAAGLVPFGPAIAPTLSVLDQFIWDRFLRRSGIAAFVNELYPSIFATGQDLLHRLRSMEKKQR